MNILDTIGSQLDPTDMQINKVAAEGMNSMFLQMYEHEYRFFEAIEELNSFMPEFTKRESDLNFFSLENWDNGMEGVIGDMWFNFVQFIKKVIRAIKTAVEHFFKGIGFRLRYFEDMRIKLRGNNNFNIGNFESTTTMAYSKSDYEDLFRALDCLRRTLNSLFSKQDFDLDGIMDFRQYGIVFVNGAVVKDLENGRRSSEFDLGFKRDATKPLYRLGWNMSAIMPMLDRLVETIKYDMKKDFEYIRFQSAMDRLVRTKEQEARKDYNEIHRLTNITKSMAAMIAYNTSTTWKMSSQMAVMLKALEAPMPAARSSEVY